MKDILARFTSVLTDPYRRAWEWKEKGGKVIGVTPMHFPEELIHAGGALPVVLQESDEPVTTGYGYIYPFYCGFTRSTVDVAVKGKLGLFDALVISDMCLQIRHMAHIMRRNMPATPFVYIQWPLAVRGGGWLDFTVEKLRRCRAELERVIGKEIEDKAVRESLSLYNRNRALLKKLYALRKEKTGLLSARDILAVALASMLMPKEEHSVLLEELLREVEGREAPGNGRVPLLVSGHLCQAVKTDILDLIEEMGGMVVADDLYTGHRYFATDADTNAPPLEALAKRYLNLAIPCPTRADPEGDWGEYLVRAAREVGAKGIISLVVKFCEPHMIYYPHLRDVLMAAGVPHLLIETEHEVVSLAGVKTRLQAFLEMVRR